MGKFNDLLNLRFKQKKPEKQNKVTALAEKSKQMMGDLDMMFIFRGRMHT